MENQNISMTIKIVLFMNAFLLAAFVDCVAPSKVLCVLSFGQSVFVLFCFVFVSAAHTHTSYIQETYSFRKRKSDVCVCRLLCGRFENFVWSSFPTRATLCAFEPSDYTPSTTYTSYTAVVSGKN